MSDTPCAKAQPDTVTVRIDSEPHNRIARVHEALRDLGLELCGKCNIWRGQERMFQVGLGSFASIVCTTCGPLPPGEADGGESQTAQSANGRDGGEASAQDAVTRLQRAIANVAQPDWPCSVGAR